MNGYKAKPTVISVVYCFSTNVTHNTHTQSLKGVSSSYSWSAFNLTKPILSVCVDVVGSTRDTHSVRRHAKKRKEWKKGHVQYILILSLTYLSVLHHYSHIYTQSVEQ